MCLAIPMQVFHLEGLNARCEAKGIQRDVSLFLLQEEDVRVGDFVLIHVGYAIQKLTDEDARLTWELFDQMAAMNA